jgi:hypothetical protein
MSDCLMKHGTMYNIGTLKHRTMFHSIYIDTDEVTDRNMTGYHPLASGVLVCMLGGRVFNGRVGSFLPG